MLEFTYLRIGKHTPFQSISLQWVNAVHHGNRYGKAVLRYSIYAHFLRESPDLFLDRHFTPFEL